MICTLDIRTLYYTDTNNIRIYIIFQQLCSEVSAVLLPNLYLKPQYFTNTDI